ncbi:imidazole glycerol phosphate synthase subunit HisF [Allosphingosinicella indica]|uniref:Imidazole glycerol phosphate synthase subunit HisF n=1 Tax=Allosphingosinicella indica TaxID=941907 RepID=A0A1X7FYN7_9SPHN|nr:imidazole glycerol phosphate synthase subunit HisF [Allosphingosinicella indica]SMF61091.1 imidazole glycerol phosphate synthase subunit hisF [Allosphingosinicella indica]
MLSHRIIPCLDVRNGRVVKGVRFRDHRDAGDILTLAARYRDAGADELVFYDITASPDGRKLDAGWIRAIARMLDIPFAVAGGIRTRDDAAACLDAGADKVSINSPALERPSLIDELARDFGRQCVVVGIDSLATPDGRRVRQYSGSETRERDGGRETLDWAREASTRGAGEIVLNCMQRDGVRQGYDIDHSREVVEAVDIPVIASGGAGRPDHFRDVLMAGASGALAASVFHDGSIMIPNLKEYLASCGLPMRR